MTMLDIPRLLQLLHLLSRSAILKFKRIDSSHTSDYDIAAATYDDYYSRHLSTTSQVLLEQLPLTEGMHVVDLACGTGFFSHRIAARIGAHGTVTAVDLSPGMLARNCEQASAKGLTNIRFVHADALQFLETLANQSVDGLVCGWGICYMDHPRLRREIERVVRPRGFVALIENRACTLSAVSTLFRKALMRYPDAIVKNVAIDLPKDQRYLVNTFCSGALRPVHAWNDRVLVPCGNGEAIAEYMVRSGASAGFLDALDKSRINDVLAEFVRLADRCFQNGRAVPVSHECCALLAERA